MQLYVSKFLNKARDYHKANPNASEYDFLDSDDYYKRLDRHDRKFALKKLILVFESNVPQANRLTVDELELREMLKY